MQLTPEQQSTVRQWVDEGASLSDVQKRLREQFNLTMTYLEARLLAGDLGLTFVGDKPAPVEDTPEDDDTGADDPSASSDDDTAEPAAPGEVSLTIDAITRPQAIVSGKVTFSDGTTGGWHLDQMGRLGLEPPSPGYRPPEADIPAFQRKLQQLLQSQGF